MIPVFLFALKVGREAGRVRDSHPTKSCLTATRIENVAGKKVLGIFLKVLFISF